MKKPRIDVTDHAMIRYLERVMGFDIEQLRREIGHKVSKACKMDIEPNSVILDGYRYTIINGKVTTVLRKNMTNTIYVEKLQKDRE